MALTLFDYRELFKRYLQEDTEDGANQYYPDAQIDGFLNSGQIAIARDLGGTLNFFRKTATLDAETGEIALPDDYLSAVNMKYSQGTNFAQCWNLQLVEEDRMDQMYPWWRSAVSGPFPTTAVMQERDNGLFFTLYPFPSVTVANAIFLNYVKLPAPMTEEEDEDEASVMVRFPELQQTLLPFAALRFATLFEAGEADDQSSKYENLYQMGLRQARYILNTSGQRFYKYGSGF